MSHGLVLFHFGARELLLVQLLEWLIEDMEALHVSDDLAAFPGSLDRLHALLQQEMSRLSRQPEHVQAMTDPDFGMDEYLTAVRKLVGRLS